ncbi:hypothetical protein [Photobacterium iliopiscarium]|uniref:hypothetical protein n=1 Tax=Photobacterium iliopiscarium TaxID=56192 RepID=UPI001F24F8E2|nr:hypothetical protein [Photobacterium iliopiscarium]MCF2245863.1 hypothetical protein [Photobacterium iliopiscarium]
MKNKIIITLGFALSLSACSDNDVSYYSSHIDDAKDKIKECNSLMEKAFRSADEAKFKSITQNVECNAARQALHEYKRNEAKLARERKQAEYAVNIKKYTKELIKMPFPAFYSLDKECLFNNSPKCGAYRDLEKSRTLSEIELIINSNKDEKLISYNNKVCAGIDYNQIQCNLSRKALDKQHSDKIKYYLTNRDKLATSFNVCQAEYQKLRTEKKYGKAMKAIDTYQCRIVRDAASKLHIYDFSKPI